MLAFENYLNVIVGSHFKSALARFRCSSHSLEIELGRRHRELVEDRLCKTCQKVGSYAVEDEYHFLLSCPAYSSLRIKYLPSVYTAYPSEQNFTMLMQTTNVRVINELARYVYFAGKQRNVTLSHLI